LQTPWLRPRHGGKPPLWARGGERRGCAATPTGSASSWSTAELDTAVRYDLPVKVLVNNNLQDQIDKLRG
jgi:hypothetical protein